MLLIKNAYVPVTLVHLQQQITAKEKQMLSLIELGMIILFALQLIILWCMIDISNTLKSQDKEIREWTK